MRILVVGASSRLGRAVIPHLLTRGWEVRAMTRHPPGLADLAAQGVDVVQGDLRDAHSVERAVRGCSQVLSAAHALTGTGRNSSEAVDLRGVHTLIAAARHAQVEHFVFTSAWGSRADHPVDFLRYKAAGELFLRSSGLSWTILRPAAFMEFWATLLGEPVLRGRPVMLLGRGQNPINYVAVQDVAHFVLVALENSAARGRIIDVGGPGNFTLREVVQVFERAAGVTARVTQVPPGVLRAAAGLIRPFNRPLARLAALAVWQDTADMRVDPARTLAQFPVRLTPLPEIAELMAAQRSPATTPPTLA